MIIERDIIWKELRENGYDHGYGRYYGNYLPASHLGLCESTALINASHGGAELALNRFCKLTLTTTNLILTQLSDQNRSQNADPVAIQLPALLQFEFAQILRQRLHLGDGHIRFLNNKCDKPKSYTMLIFDDATCSQAARAVKCSIGLVYIYNQLIN